MARERRGRKTKLTDDIIKSVYTGIKNRIPWNKIAYLADIDPKTLRNWRNQGERENRGLYRKLADTIKRAESELKDEVLFQAPDMNSQRRFIYFIQGEITRLIKIGQTRKHPDRRLSELQNSSPDKLTLLKVIHAGKGDEAQLHAQFAFDRMHGEWFFPSQRLLKFIESLEGLSGFVEPDDQ